jgi:hypothetical protein
MLSANPVIVVAIAYVAAVAFFFARGLKPGARSAAFVLLAVIVLGSAILLETNSLAIRWVVGGLLVAIFLPHMWDLHLDPARGGRLSLRAYIVFVGDYAWSVARVADGYGVDLPFKRRLLDAGKYVAGLGVVTVVTVRVFKIDWAAYPFLLEHAIKSTCLAACTVWAFHTNTALWRLAGAPAAFFTAKNVLWAYSPADFWRRWNRPMYRWLLENIYKPLGGRRNPHLATLGAFAVSGLLHEYLFGVTLQRVTGYPTAFFLLHGLAAVLTRRFKPAGWLMLPAILFTFAFNTASTLLLLIPINERIPVYVSDVPKWMYLC